MPVALAMLSLFGLLSALLGQGGIWWLLSWVALVSPLAVIVLCLLHGGMPPRCGGRLDGVGRRSHDRPLG